MILRISVPVRVILLLLSSSAVCAEVAPVTVYAPEAKAWVGQHLPFFVELRARGTFAGTASFDLPQLHRTLLMKIGDPVVGTRELEGESWFVQKHEFVLFSQEPGMLEVPAISVRFARREGFTGPASDVQAQSPGLTVEIRQPPGSEDIGFLVTTESLEVTETWDPPPGPAEAGAIFKRTITQRATRLPGMALAPALGTAPEGIRVYTGDAETNDKLTRGEFIGERRETVTYLLQKPGIFELPKIDYVWWNPKAEKLQSKSLPAVTFEVAPPVMEAAEKPFDARGAWPWLLVTALIVAAGAWQRQRLAAWARRHWSGLNPPSRVVARQLLRACRAHDAAAAEAAWAAWRNTLGATFRPGPELSAAVLALHRHLFGPAPKGAWQGNELARAFNEHRVTATMHHSRVRASTLPLLNP